MSTSILHLFFFTCFLLLKMQYLDHILECPIGPSLKVVQLRRLFDWINMAAALPQFFGAASHPCFEVSGPGGFSHWHGIRICACLLRHFFAKFGIAIGGFSSETKEPKLHKLGVFWANCCKKHPIWSKLGAFLSKMVYRWVGNLAKNWYRDSQIFEVRQAHPRTILVKEPPPRG